MKQLLWHTHTYTQNNLHAVYAYTHKFTKREAWTYIDTTWTFTWHIVHTVRHKYIEWHLASHFTLHSNIPFLWKSFKVRKMSAMPHIHFSLKLQYAYSEWNIPNHGALPSHHTANSTCLLHIPIYNSAWYMWMSWELDLEIWLEYNIC